MRIRSLILSLGLCALVAGCAGSRPADLGAASGRFTPCPSSPNCVSSDDSDEQHGAEPFQILGDADAVWRAAREIVSTMERTAIVTDRDDYLHAESTSALMGYVDDLELQLRRADGVIAVRSASRVGYGDGGVNRDRVEALRAALVARGLLAK